MSFQDTYILGGAMYNVRSSVVVWFLEVVKHDV